MKPITRPLALILIRWVILTTISVVALIASSYTGVPAIELLALLLVGAIQLTHLFFFLVMGIFILLARPS